MKLQSEPIHKITIADRIYPHIIGWSVFILYEIGFVYLSTGTTYTLISYICYYSLNIALFYTNVGLLNYSFRQRFPYLKAILFGFVALTISVAIKYYLDQVFLIFNVHMWSKPGYLYKFGVQNTFRGLYFLVFSTLYWAFLRFIAYRKNANEKERLNLVILKEKAELENKFADVRNAYLQHQINPHLLFNTLNFIYNKVYQNSESASECVFLLAEIMRYSLEEADQSGKKLLEKEVEQIENLIKINRLRYNHPLYIHFIVTGRFTGVKIIPLILLTFVENVFKHGNLKIEEDKAIMELNVNENNELTFTTRNIKKQQNPNDRLKSIGVENAIKRLSYNYPDQYKLNINDEEGTFNLYLYMRL